MINLFRVFLLILLMASSSSFAGEGLFSRTYTVDTTPKGHYEFEQLVRNRSQRSFGKYSAFDFSTELEYGITDDFQVAFYVNSGHIDASGAPDDDDPDGHTGFTRHKTYLEGFATEFIYRVKNPVTDGYGLALYLEPEYYFKDKHNGLDYATTFENEFRIILQKNLLDDRLIIAYNLVTEIAFIRFKGEDSWAGEFELMNELGVTYLIAPNWYTGWELRNHNEIGDFHTHEHSVYWTGPAVHYANQKFWLTLGVLKQIYGDPNGFDSDGVKIGGGKKFQRSHENWETTVKFGLPF